MTDEPTNPEAREAPTTPDNPTLPKSPDRVEPQRTEERHPTITEDEIEDLFAKLDELRHSLTTAQQALLSAILRVAAELRDESEPGSGSFSEQFAGSFKLTLAERVLTYAHGAGGPSPHPGAIFRAPGAIFRNSPRP